MHMKRYSATALAKMKGVAPKNLLRSFERHGIKPDKNGKWTEADYHMAHAVGAAMDKAKFSKKLKDAEENAAGKPLQSPTTLTYMKLQRQVKKLDMEIQIQQIEIDKHLEKLADVKEISDKIIKRDTELSIRINVWRELQTAKNPHMREAIEQMHRELCAMLAEPAGYERD